MDLFWGFSRTQTNFKYWLVWCFLRPFSHNFYFKDLRSSFTLTPWFLFISKTRWKADWKINLILLSDLSQILFTSLICLSSHAASSIKPLTNDRSHALLSVFTFIFFKLFIQNYFLELENFAFCSILQWSCSSLWY